MTDQKPPAPAIGTPEWFRTLPAAVHTRSELTYTDMRVWTDDKGNVKGTIDLGSVEVTFRTPGQARDLIGQLAALAGEMDAEITRQRAAEVVKVPGTAAWVCVQCGISGPPMVIEDDGPQCYNTQRCAERVAARDAEAAQAGAR